MGDHVGFIALEGQEVNRPRIIGYMVPIADGNNWWYICYDDPAYLVSVRDEQICWTFLG
jgi:hypothetical protein